MTVRRGVHPALIALLGGVLTPLVLAQPAAAAPADCADVRQDEASALATAKACKRQVEVIGQRGERERLFANPAGHLTAEISASPVRVKKGTEWVPVDTTLRKNADGTITPVASPLAITLSGGGHRPFVTAAKDGKSFSLGWPGTLPAPVLSGDTAVYPEVLPGVDLKVQADAQGFAEVLVVKTPEAAKNPALRKLTFTTSGSGLTVKSAKDGGFAAVDAAGQEVFGSGAPMMWDAGRAQAPAAGTRKGLVATPAETGAVKRKQMPAAVAPGSITIEPDQELLTGADTSFPLSIDPSASEATNGWTMINSYYPTTSYWSYDRNDGAKVGYSDWDNTVMYRSVFTFPTGRFQLPGATVLKATFSAQLTHSWTCGGGHVDLHHVGAVNSGTTWNNHSGSWGSPLVSVNPGNCTGNVEFSNDALKAKLQEATGWNGATFGLKARDEGGHDSWKKFKHDSPVLAIDFNRPPNMPTSLSVDNKPCATGQARPWITTATPTLRAWASDPDTDQNLRTWIAHVKHNGTSFDERTAAGGYQDGPAGGYTAQWTASGLADGGIYAYRAQSTDSHGKAGPITGIPGNCEFGVDLVDPAKPSIDNDLYAEGCQPCGGGGQPGRFTFTSSLDVVAYNWGFTDPPATRVSTSRMGAPVTVTWTPQAGGPKTLYVQAIDRAGRTATREYQFTVAGYAINEGRWLQADMPVLGDNSGHNRHLTATVPPTTVHRIVDGGGYGFDGTANPIASTAGPVIADTTKSFTVSAWAKADPGTGQAVVVGQDGNRISGFMLWYGGDSTWRFGMPTSDSDGFPVTIATASGAKTGVWTHLIAAYDEPKKQLKLYVNGKLATTTPHTATVKATGQFTIGRDKVNGAANGGALWRGGLADVRAWSRLLVDHEIAEIVAPSEVAEWHFDQEWPPETNTGDNPNQGENDLNLYGGFQVPFDGSGNCKVGTCLLLDSTGYGDTQYPVLDTSQSYTISVWARLSDKNEDHNIVSQRNPSGVNPFFLQYDKSTDRWNFEIPDSATPAKRWYTRSVSVPAVNVWTHLTAIYDAQAGQARLYVNGVLEATLNGVTAWNGYYPLVVGTASGRSWKGALDELRIHTGVKAPDTSPVGSSIGIATGDFNGDGKADVAGVDASGDMRLYPGDAKGRVTGEAQLMWPGGNEWGGFKRIAGGDFNGDTKADIAGVDALGDLRFFEGDGTGKLRNDPMMWPDRGAWAAFRIQAAGDFNGDGKPDVAAITTDGYLRLYTGDGKGYLAGAGLMWTNPDWGSGHLSIAAGDFNGDGKCDLVSLFGNQVYFYPGDGAGRVSHGGPMWQDAGWGGYTKGITAGDFNGDGKMDLAAVTPQNSMYFFAGAGDGKLANSMTPMWPDAGAWAAYTKGYTAGDFDGDGKTDLAAISGADNNLYFFKGDGTGKLTGMVLMTPGLGRWGAARTLVSGDFTGDGKPDIAGIDGENSMVMFGGEGSGRAAVGTKMWPSLA